jgi:hypothetical protein
MEAVGNAPSDTVQDEPPSEVVMIPSAPAAKQTVVDGQEMVDKPSTPLGAD